MAYRIDFTPAADRQFRKLPHTLQLRIKPRIDALADKPRPRGVKRIVDGDLYWIRIGDYRVIYEIRDGEQVIEVAIVKHRREAY